MQILINGRFLDGPISGVERYALGLSALILKNRPEAFFIVPERSGRTPTKRTIRSGVGHGHFWEQTTLARESRKSDLLISPANTGPLMGGRQIVVIHDMSFWHHPEWYDKGFARTIKELIPRLVKQAEHIITLSEYSKTDMCRTLFIPPQKVTVVPPFTEFTGEHDVPNGLDRPYFLVVGSTDPRKNLRNAIEAFKRIASREVDLVIVGRRISSLHDAMANEDNPRIKFLDDVQDEQLEGLYKGATALLNTSTFAGFGFPILEAMACETPVICSDIPVFREVFGDAPYYIDPMNVDQIANALDRVAMHRDVARFHARKGSQVAAHYTPDRSWRVFSKVLESQLSKDRVQ